MDESVEIFRNDVFFFLLFCFVVDWNLEFEQASPISILVSRVNQFDAARLDVEMSAMLKEQLLKVFSLLKV